MAEPDYLRWMYYPQSKQHCTWVDDLVQVFGKQRETLDTSVEHHTSNQVLGILRDGLLEIGYQVEGSEYSTHILRPVHFGERGVADRQYRIDCYHPETRIGLEIEAGRSVRGNAIYQDIIQTCLLIDVDFMAVAVPQFYRFKTGSKEIEDRPYEFAVAHSVLDAIYSSDRLRFPVEGTLILGF